MPRKATMMGSMAMGGPGKKPKAPPTPFGGPATPPITGGSGMGPGSGTGPMSTGPRAMPGSGMRASPGGVRAFAKGGEAEKIKKHAHGGPVHSDEKQDRALFKKMEKEEDKGEKVMKHAHGGPVIAGHTTHGGGHGLGSHPHPVEQGISKGHDGRRGGVKGGGLESISSTMTEAKPRHGHKKGS